MELLKEIVIDFCLFSLIEGYIFCLFFEKIGGCRKFKWYEILIFGFINCIVSSFIMPLLYQSIGLFYMAIWIKIRENMKFIDGFKISLFASIYILILEMCYSLAFSIIFKNDLFFINKFMLFVLMIPIKIFEIILINKIKRRIYLS